MAKDIKSFFSSPSDNGSGLSDLDIYTSRPLTCYPDQGTGTGFPFKLIDYRIPLTLTPTDSSSMSWTHKYSGDSPPQYPPALNLALQHFDAEHLLEAEQERKLTLDEKETLDGCRLLQSMLHDLDCSLENVRSFDAYEDELYNKVVPLIYDTFDGLDEESGSVLQVRLYQYLYPRHHLFSLTSFFYEVCWTNSNRFSIRNAYFERFLKLLVHQSDFFCRTWCCCSACCCKNYPKAT